MTESIVEQLEGQATQQAQIRAVEGIRRTGAEDAEGVAEYLSGFEPAQQMQANQRAFAQKIKRIRENVHLSDGERLEAGTKAASEAQERHAELVEELTRQTSQRTAALERKLYSAPVGGTSGYRQALLGLANAARDQLDTLADTARAAGDMTLLRAIRTTAATKGFDSLVAKTVALDTDARSPGYRRLPRLRLHRTPAPPDLGRFRCHSGRLRSASGHRGAAQAAGARCGAGRAAAGPAGGRR